MSEPTSDFCAAYACPLLGVYGSGGKWYCFCHRDSNPGAHDAITAVLNQHKALVDHSLLARRSGRPDSDIENELNELTREAGEQRSAPTAKIIGPTHAMTHYTEQEQ